MLSFFLYEKNGSSSVDISQAPVATEGLTLFSVNARSVSQKETVS